MRMNSELLNSRHGPWRDTELGLRMVGAGLGQA